MQTLRPIASPLAGLLPVQQVREGESYRLLHYVVQQEVEEGLLLYNVLTKAIALLSPEEAGRMAENPAAVPELVTGWFAVPVLHDDRKLALEVRAVGKMLQNPPHGYRSFTIFTTTDCNARCFYCYEKGRSRIPMKEETAREVAAWILKHKKAGDIRLRWFGGEPLYNRPVMAIPANAFLAQETIDRISLPGSVVSIGEQAFQNCFALLSMELPNVRHLDASAFQNCSNLTTITIGGGIDAIPQNAFAGCINLESVIIPTSVINMVKQIGVDAFYQCHKLKVIAPNTSNDIVLLQGVTYVGLEAFFGAHSLTNVQMMNATYLGASAFGDCINLSTVNFKKAENVQASCFYGDESLTQVSLPKAWFVSSNVFRDCTSLETVSLASVQQVGDYAFANTSSLQTVKFGPDLASLGNYIFYYDLSTSTDNYQIDGYFAGGVPAITDKTFVQNDNPAFHDFEFQTIYIKEEYRDDFANAWQNAYGSYGYWNGDSF